MVKIKYVTKIIVSMYQHSGGWGAPTVDTSAPETTVTRTLPVTSPSSSTTATFIFSSSDHTAAGSTFQCSYDGADYDTCSSGAGHTITDITEGTHTLTVIETNAAGLVGSEVSATWIVDTSPPRTIIQPIERITTATSVAFTFTSTDNTATGSTFQCSLDGADTAPCNSGIGYSGITDGRHRFYVIETNAVGLTGVPVSFSWTVDTTAPVTTVTRTSPIPVLSSSTTATFTFSSEDNTASASRFQCSYDGAAYASCSSGKDKTGTRGGGYNGHSIAGVTDGEHILTVTETNAAGLEGAPVSNTWIVDTSAPITTVTRTLPVTSPTISTTATFTFTSTDHVSFGGSTFQCQLDSGAFTACSSLFTTVTLSVGTHMLTVIETNAVGLSGAAVTSSWTIIDVNSCSYNLLPASSSMLVNSAAGTCIDVAHQSTCSILCNSGYSLLGSPSVRCVQGSFSGSQRCVRGKKKKKKKK
jgi:hypothetical protein